MANLQDTDVLPVGRGAATYKATFKDVKDSLPVVPDASETAKGVVELATAAETTAGADATRAVTPAGLKVELDKKIGDAPDSSTDGSIQYARQVVTAGATNTKSWAPVSIPPGTHVGETPPATPANGQQWWHSGEGRLYVYYDEGTSGSKQWVAAVPESEITEVWSRSGTELIPTTPGDSAFVAGGVKVGGTTAAPNIDLKADGGIVVNTDGLFYDAATRRLGLGTDKPDSPLQVNGNTPAHFRRTSTGFCNVLLSASSTQWSTGVHSDGYYAITHEGVSERVRIDASGRLLVGTTSTSAGTAALFQGGGADRNDPGTIFLARGDANILNDYELGLINFSDSNHGVAARVGAYRDGGTWNTSTSRPTRLTFSTTADGASSPAERMRIGSNGTIATTQTSASTIGLSVGLASGSYTSDGVSIWTATAASTSFAFLRCWTASFASLAFQVVGNGDVKNTNNSYGAISDIKLKENIVDAKPQWDDIKALRVVNYNFKKETGAETFKQLGLIAQEVETVCPGLVSEAPDRDEEGNDLGTVTKSVNYSVLYMKAVKALQEAMERIETLETANASLEARLTALEAR